MKSDKDILALFQEIYCVNFMLSVADFPLKKVISE